jgi:excisionase family DNA binding protein
MEDAFLTTGEVLAYLQVNLRTVYRLIREGKLPAVRVGRQWRFRKTDIDEWLAGHRRGAAPPRPTEPRPVAPVAPAAPAGAGRPKVLVVDDEASIRDLLAKTLALAEYEVDTAPDGREALDALRARPYDLLVTDLKMPVLDGMGLIREARRLAPRLPIVVITAHSTEATAIESVNLGVNGYLTKPFRIAKILSTTARILGE